MILNNDTKADQTNLVAVSTAKWPFLMYGVILGVKQNKYFETYKMANDFQTILYVSHLLAASPLFRTWKYALALLSMITKCQNEEDSHKQ